MTDIKSLLINNLWEIIINYVDGDIDVGLDLDKFNWSYLSCNPSAVYILEKESKNEYSRIDWAFLASNRSPMAMQILEKNIHYLDIIDGSPYDYTDRWDILVGNPFGMDIIEKHLDKIDLYLLMSNTSDRAMDIIERNIIKFDDLYLLSDNHSKRAVHIIEKHCVINDVYLDGLSANPFAIHIIEKDLDSPTSRVNWDNLSSNISIKAINILTNNQDKLNWTKLSKNPAAIHLLETNINTPTSQVDWKCLSENPEAIHILEKYMDKIDWTGLSMNPSAIHLLETNINTPTSQVDWKCLSENPEAIHILEKNMDKIDYEGISRNDKFFTEYPNIKLRKLLDK